MSMDDSDLLMDADHELAQAGASPLEDDGAGVREFITALIKAVRATQTYAEGNALIAQFVDSAAEQMATLWERTDHVTLTVDEDRFLWQDQTVYAKEIGPANLAFMFFRNGIRVISFLQGFEQDQLADFVAIIGAGLRGADEDLLATLWHRDLDAFQMEYVDVAEDENLELPQPDRNAGEGETIEDLEEIEDVVASGELPPDEEEAVAAITLSEADYAYLNREMEAEWLRPLARDVTLALLDQFEMRDVTRRKQVIDILREFLPLQFSKRDFSNVALIVTELQLLANKTGDEETQELVTSLLKDMSEAMAELVAEPEDDGGPGPEADEVRALADALQSEAIPTLIRAVPAVANQRTQHQLMEALDRLVQAHPESVQDLLISQDSVLVAESARIIGRLSLKSAEPALVALMERPDHQTRQAAIGALIQIGSAQISRLLKTALEDEHRDIRMTAVRALATLDPDAAAATLADVVTGTSIREREASEQMSLFKAYAEAAGPKAVPVLARLLNQRSWYGSRGAPTVRAGAARALGLLHDPAARKALDKAAKDKDDTVRNAVRVALKAHAHAPEADGPGAEEIE
ncbi:MAG: HEAT repeat domain-containing protein [Gemmatimonadota bacterium]